MIIPTNFVSGDFLLFAQELALTHEAIEVDKNYESVVNAIQLEWIEQALLDTSKASIRRRRLPAQHE